MRCKKCIFVLIIFILSLFSSCTGEPEKKILRNISRAKRSDLVVLNFRNNTDENRFNTFQPWGFGLAAMMMTDLETVGLFNIISSKDVKDLSSDLDIEYSEMGAVEDTLKAGKIVSARYVLSGSFMEMEGQLRIEARVFEVETERQVGAASVKGRTDNFFALQKKLVLKVTRYLQAVLNENEAFTIKGNIETKSVNASLNNYAGEIAVLRAREYREKGQSQLAETYVEKAKQNFETALTYDPEYKRAKRNLSELVMGMPMTL